ncbi:acetylornithine and succinylornithine aminotransferase [Clavulina sp. PMI_390]|nr:acetylornithine and succinylornithine aminotransferase [Clavulina sp. PMI_390]
MHTVLRTKKTAPWKSRAIICSGGHRNASTKPSTKYTTVTHPEGPEFVPSHVATKLARFSNYTLNTYARPDFIITHGKGNWVYAASPSSSSSQHEGVAPSSPTASSSAVPSRKYLDFTAGIAVNALGHGDEQFAEVMREQTLKISHVSNLYHNEWAGELAQLLVQLTQRDGGLGFAPNSSPSAEKGAKVFFSNTGAEANEGALKFARKVAKDRWLAQNPSANGDASACEKTGIVCFENGFHGRTMGALSVTTNPKYQAPFAPLIPGVRVGKLNDASKQAMRSLIDETTCTVIVEPIQGEGGVRASEVEFLRGLRKRCNEVGAVLIYDEIQCGLFRTGSMWAHSSLPLDCHPDIVTMAKPLANGFPISAILVTDEIANAISIGSHGTTFGGSPLATRLGHHVLSRISDPAFLSSLSSVSAHLRSRLAQLPLFFPDLIHPELRGRGLISGIAFKNPSHPGQIMQMARERGVLLLTAGSDAVRLVPSLNVSQEEVDMVLDVIESCLPLLK